MVIVPTAVKLDVTTVELRVVPVSVPAAAVTVPDAPKAMLVPLTVTVLLVNALFGMLLNVLLLPLIVLFVSVCTPVSVATVLSIAMVTAVPPL